MGWASGGLFHLAGCSYRFPSSDWALYLTLRGRSSLVQISSPRSLIFFSASHSLLYSSKVARVQPLPLRCFFFRSLSGRLWIGQQGFSISQSWSTFRSSSVLASPFALELEEDLLLDAESLGLVEHFRFCFRLPLERFLLFLLLCRERLPRDSSSESELSSIVLSSELSVSDLRLRRFFAFFFSLAGLLRSCLSVLKARSASENVKCVFCANSHMTPMIFYYGKLLYELSKLFVS